MSEMSKAQMPAGGDPDPDPTADLVPPGATDYDLVPPVADVPAEADGSDSAEGGTPEQPQPGIEQVLPNLETPEGGDDLEPGLGEPTASDPMPDMSGSSPEPNQR